MGFGDQIKKFADDAKAKLDEQVKAVEANASMLTSASSMQSMHHSP